METCNYVAGLSFIGQLLVEDELPRRWVWDPSKLFRAYIEQGAQ
jgi:hypothetical protein